MTSEQGNRTGIIVDKIGQLLLTMVKCFNHAEKQDLVSTYLKVKRKYKIIFVFFPT